MKFYYKGQLIRTSKTHEYKWALIRELPDGSIKALACSATQQGAGKDYNYYRKRYLDHVKVYVAPLDKAEA